MKLLATIVAALLLGLVATTPGAAQSAKPSVEDQSEALPPPKRARTQIRVRPLYPYRRYHSLYPPANAVDFPGPNAHRECVNRYVTEHRPSGTVVMPRMRCRWVRGRIPFQ